MKVKVAIFDGEGVLYSSEKATKVFYREYDKFLKKFGADVKKQEELFFKLRPKMVVGRITLREANRLIFKKLGIPSSKVDEWLKKDRQVALKHVKLKRGVEETLLKLRKSGIKIAILSDTVHPLKWRVELLGKLGLKKGKTYDRLFLSSTIGYEKPHPKAYLTVLKSFKVKPEEAIFIGHDEEEMEGAKKLGIRTISFSSLRRHLDKICALKRL